MKRTNKAGYVLVYAPKHPAAQRGGRVLEHRRVWVDAHGPIPRGLVVHHKNGIKDDNRLENLELMSMSEHSKEHFPGKVSRIRSAWRPMSRFPLVKAKCYRCGVAFEKTTTEYRKALSRNKSHAAFCSKRCATIHRHSMKKTVGVNVE